MNDPIPRVMGAVYNPIATIASGIERVASSDDAHTQDDSARIPGVPDVYYAHRVRQLVEVGKLESQGNLAYMRYCEARLPVK